MPSGADELTISVASYYPIKEIVNYFNYHYGWKVSYEAPLYLESQLTDIAVPAWKKAHPGERGYYVPGWIELRLRVTKPAAVPGEQPKILNQLIRQYNNLDRLDKFSVQSDSDARQTIVGSVQGRQIWEFARLAPQVKETSGSEYLQRIVEQCGAQMPLPLITGTVSVNALMHTRILPHKATISCRNALNTLTERISADSVYQVMEDIGDGMYVVSIGPNRAFQPQQ